VPLSDAILAEQLAAALRARDLVALRRIPKADLHCHGLLSAPFSAYERLAEAPLPPPPRSFGSFQTFSAYIAEHLLPVLARGREVARAIVRAAFERFADDGVVYAEPSFDLLLPAFLQMEVEELAEMIGGEAARVSPRLTVAPEIGIARTVPADVARPWLERFLATGAFRSVDLYDREDAGALDDFIPLYRRCEESGLKLKAHAGEMCGPDRVREAVEKLHLHAVQHGVRAAEDPALLADLAARGISLNICPTSNVSLGVCESLERHPARRLFDAGVRITVNSDDHTLFGAGVSEELLNLARMGFSASEIAGIVANGLAARRGADPVDAAGPRG
jgi:adenosine deaminase